MTPLLWITAALLAAGAVIAGAGWLLEHHTRRPRQHRAPAEERTVDAGPPPGMPNRRRVDVGPGGRHRRTDAPGEHTATGILRAIRNSDDALPPIPRATRAQLRDPRR